VHTASFSICSHRLYTGCSQVAPIMKDAMASRPPQPEGDKGAATYYAPDGDPLLLTQPTYGAILDDPAKV